MTTQASLNETMQGKSDFIHFEDRASEHPFVEKVWRCHSDRADTFLSIATNNFEVAITRLGGKSFSHYVDRRPQQLPLIVLQRESGSVSVSRWVLSCRDFSQAVYGITKM